MAALFQTVDVEDRTYCGRRVKGLVEKSDHAPRSRAHDLFRLSAAYVKESTLL